MIRLQNGNFGVLFLLTIIVRIDGNGIKNAVGGCDRPGNNTCINENDPFNQRNGATKLRCALTPRKLVECGFPGITQAQCIAEPGCCYNEKSRSSWCYIDSFRVEYSCDFTNDKCHWTDDTTVPMRWERHQGKIIQQGDYSPPGDHTSGASGWFLFINSTSAKKITDVARIKSEMIGATDKTCFQFWYHMNGPNMGTLSVYRRKKKEDTTTMSKIWTRSGTIGPHWRHGVIELSSEQSFQIYVEGTAGNGPSSIIAVDDFSVNAGACPPSSECTFEDSSLLCGWKIVSYGAIDWRRLNGRDAGRAGPKTDHTYGTNLGYYLTVWYYRNLRKPPSYFISGVFPKTSGQCCSFWFMAGRNRQFTASVVQTVGKKSKETTVWTTRSYGNSWQPGTFSIISPGPYQIKFYASRSAVHSAIDDIMITEQVCNSPGSCDFETGTCHYTNSQNDDFDWMLGAGITDSDVAPYVDHTTGSFYGQYMFLPPQSKEIHESAVLDSESIDVSGIGKCVSFWYYMNGTDVGSLHVKQEINGQLLTVWQLFGDQPDDFWIPALVPIISNGKTIRIHFVGIRGFGEKGKVGIDDIFVNDHNGTCLTNPIGAVAWGCPFEGGMCNWQSKSEESEHWLLTDGTNIPFAPRGDHTIQRYYTDLGCWTDRAARAITTLEGKCKRLKGHYRRKDAFELCYQCALERGFKYFALQDGGWCASSANAGSRYKMYGRSRRCRGKGLGGPAANRVYKLSAKGKYMFFKANWAPVRTVSSFISPNIATVDQKYSPYCVSFWYNQMGRFPSSPFNMYVLRNGKRQQAIWQTGRRSANRWFQTKVQVNVNNNDQVVFEGVRGMGFNGGVALDDIDIAYGDCKFSGTCSFENPDICGWSSKGKKLQWTRKSASTIGNNSKPSTDHTYNTKFGHFMYINATSVTKRTTAKLISSTYRVSTVSCLQFYYYMDMDGGKSMLRVKIKIPRSAPYPGFEAIGNHNDGWNFGQATISSIGTFNIYVLAKLYPSNSVVMAVDDFSIKSGNCPPIGNCDFENGFCAWRQDIDDDYINWQLGSGDTPGFNTGPHVDHTTNTSFGFYAFIDSTQCNHTSDTPPNAVIKSVWFEPTPGRCLSFWYDMFGNGLPILYVFLSDQSQQELTELWALSGSQSDNWLHAQVPIVSDKTYQILIQAVCDGADVAIDDIKFTNRKCSVYPRKASPTASPTKPGLTSVAPTVGNNQVDCNFEKNFCPTWKANATRKEFNWIRHQGATDTRDTGPQTDHTKKTPDGYYIYIDASSPAELNDTAWLTNENIDNKQGGCFEFWYHMYGENVGTLSLYSTVDGDLNWQWFRMGTQDDQWKSGQIYINKADGPKISLTFVGTRGDGYVGDIALDDFSFAVGKQCQYKQCTFEQPTPTNYDELQCGWTNEKKTDDFDWHIENGGESSVGSGPEVDHTLGTDQGHYAMMRARSHSRGNKAVMISQVYTPTIGQCFTFWFFKDGYRSGTLSVLQRTNGNDTLLWKQDGSEGDYWRRALVPVKSLEDNFQMVIQGVVGSRSSQSNIGLDDIEKIDGNCPLPGNCDFEDFMLCEYAQIKNDDFDWMRGRGTTKTKGTGPSLDHTKGDATGHYYYINSAAEKTGRRAQLISQKFPATDPDQGRCLQFYRHMYGPGIGSLNIYSYVDSGYRSRKTLLWSVSGNQGDTWIQGQLPVFSSKPFRIVIEAVVGYLPMGDIAIDDISFSNYFTPCSYIPTSTAPSTPPPTTITPADSNCTFDSRSLCRWTNIEDNDQDWQVSYTDRRSGTGPSDDHTQEGEAITAAEAVSVSNINLSETNEVFPPSLKKSQNESALSTHSQTRPVDNESSTTSPLALREDQLSSETIAMSASSKKADETHPTKVLNYIENTIGEKRLKLFKHRKENLFDINDDAMYLAWFHLTRDWERIQKDAGDKRVHFTNSLPVEERRKIILDSVCTFPKPSFNKGTKKRNTLKIPNHLSCVSSIQLLELADIEAREKLDKKDKVKVLREQRKEDKMKASADKRMEKSKKRKLKAKDMMDSKIASENVCLEKTEYPKNNKKRKNDKTNGCFDCGLQYEEGHAWIFVDEAVNSWLCDKCF